MSALRTHQKSAIDRLWTEFWTSGITNPLTAIEQISFLMFVRLLDEMEATGEREPARAQRSRHGRFASPLDIRRWSCFKQRDAIEMLRIVRDEVFPHLRRLSRGTTFSQHMQDAQLMIQKPSLLASAVKMIDKLPLRDGDSDRDGKGDLYEYLLSKLTTAGINGQFRTPRHIIRFMVELVEPRPTETLGDPACGTSGFLVGTLQYLREKYTSARGVLYGDDGEKIYTGDLLLPYRSHIRSTMLYGFDLDATMLRIASMNLMLHGVDDPGIHYQDTLSSAFPERFPRQAADFFDVILANPPFTGSLDAAEVHPTLTRAVKTRKTELLFVALILRMLKPGGRSATLVPEGVLFGSSRAHTALRQRLLVDNQLEAVISLPAGVFKPYAGVCTAILVFKKGGRTDQVFFYDVADDGFSLDDKREPVPENDLPDALTRWRERSASPNTDRAAKHFMVPAREIAENSFDLSIKRYRQARPTEVKYDPPKLIAARLRSLEAEIAQELAELEGML